MSELPDPNSSGAEPQDIQNDDGANDVQMESASNGESGAQSSLAVQPNQVANEAGPNQQHSNDPDAEMANQDDGSAAAAPVAAAVAAVPNLAQTAVQGEAANTDDVQRNAQTNNPAQPSTGDIVNPNEDMEETEQIASGSGIKLEERVRISSLPLEEKQKALKAFWDTCWGEAKEGEFIDAIDSVQKWSLGSIAEKDDTTVRVHFDGWSNKWDFNYRWTSYRIAPFRRYSKGYTGQIKIPFRNNMSFSKEWVSAQTSIIDDIIATDFQEMSAKQLTQYLRGSLFVNLDFVLSSNTYTDENVLDVIEFAKAAIRLVIAWLKKVPLLFQKCLKEIKQEAEIFLVDEDTAILLSVSEVLGILQRLFCGCHRCMRFYMHYDLPQIRSENSIAKECYDTDFEARRTPIDQEYDIDEMRERIYNRHDDLVFGSALNFLNYFNDQGGFAAFSELLKIGNARPTDEEIAADKSKAEYELIPLETIGDLTNAFLNCRALMKEQFAQDFVNEVEAIMKVRLLQMRDAEVKELDKDGLQGILNQFRNFLSITKGDDEISELIEQIQMFFASRFLKTTYLEKRLKGVSEVRSLIERVDAKTTIERQYEKAHQMGNVNYRKMGFITGAGGIKIRPTQYLDADLLKKWLIEEKIAETIFGEGAHPEILKRAGPVLIFLAQHNCLTEEIVDMVWKSQQGKHEETVRVVYNMIIEIIDHLPIPLLQFLFAKVQEVPESQYSEMYLQFIKDYTLRALQTTELAQQYRAQAAEQNDESPSDVDPDAESPVRPAKVESDQEMMLRVEKTVFTDIQKAMESPETVARPKGLHLYGLPIFWKIAQDEYTTQSDLSDAEILKLALSSMTEIFEQQSAKNIRMYYLLNVLNNLRNGHSIFISIQVFCSIMDGIDSYLMNDYSQQHIKLTKQQALEHLEKQIGLVDIILKDISLYDQHVKNILKNLVKKDLQTPENVENHIFVGKHGHKKALQLFYDFLEFVVIDSNWAVTIREANIDTLWRLFVLQPNFIQDQAVFLNFINKARNRSNRNNQWDVNNFNRGSQVIYLFTDDEQKHLFTQILCNPTFIDFQNMSSALAKCFHTYFKLINIQSGHMEQFRSKLEVVDFQKLVGLDTLWQLSFESQNDKARDESRELLVDVHLRLGSSYDLESRREIMQKFVEKAMAVLMDASNNIQSENSEQKALSVVQTLSEFLDRYEGKRPIKPEMKFSSYYSYNLWTIQVTFKNNATQSKDQKVQISQFESLGAVRQKCANAFNLELNEFVLAIKNTKVDQDDDDDKYVRDYGMSQQVFLYINQQYDKKGHPKYILAQNQDYFQLLFALLSKSKNLLLEPVWDLLQRLPVNQKLHEDIKELHEAQKDWNNILDSSSTHKLLYSLKIIEGLKSSIASQSQKQEGAEQENQPVVDESKVSNIHEWKAKFVELGGFNHLLYTFTGLQIQTIDSKLTLRCIESLLSQLQEFCNLEVALQQNILDKKEQVVLSCLKYIHMIGQFTIQIEKQRGEAFEDIQQKRAQKKQAKQKMKQLQMAGLSKNMRKQASNEDNDSDEEDECTELINSVMHEFAALRAVNEKLFSFMMTYVFLKDESSLHIIEQYADFRDFLFVNMLTTENFKIRLETGKKLKEILQMCSNKPSLSSTIVFVLKVLLVEIVPLANNNERRSHQLFDQTRRIIEDLHVADFAPLEEDLWHLLQDNSKEILTSESLEQNTKTEDRILNGKLSILRVLLQKYPKRKQEIGKTLVPHLLHDCLFEVPHRSGQVLVIGGHSKSRPKCKSQNARKSAFNLLSVLARDNLDNLKLVLEYIQNFGKEGCWRTNKQSDWAITHFDDEKSTTGFVGLKNLGCICYMISFFQQLFMVPSFRDDLLAVEDPNHDNNQEDENMFYQFQALFQGLLRSEKQYVNPKGFCHSFKDWEGQPTNVLEQMDAEEFLNMFMDRLETAIKGTAQEKTIQGHFGGKFANEMICQTCPHQYERSENFLNIGVPVKNKKSLQESLMAFIQGDMLEGDNAYHCEKCDKKVDTLKRTCVKELPRFLIISLKRFEFDFDRMVRVKVNDYLEFPVDLDMFPYTQEGLSRREAAAKNKKDTAEKGEVYIEPTEEEPRKYPSDYYEFKLKGIVVHTGTADSGHYYSFIRETNQNGEKWYEFNDDIVRDFDISELSNECFGGEDSYIGQNMISVKTQKWRNAYLMIYERKNQDILIKDEEVVDGPSPTKLSKKDSKIEEELNLEDDVKDKEKPVKCKIDDEDHPIQQKIRLENQKYWQNKFLFGTEYFEFVSDITHFWDTANMVPLVVLNCNNDSAITGYEQRQPAAGNLNSDILKPLDEILDLRQNHSNEEIADSSHEVFKFQAIFYLTILQRNQNKSQFLPKALHCFKAYLNNDSRNGHWLIKQMTNWELIEENFLQTTDTEMPKFVVGLIYSAMLSIYQQEKDQLNCHWQSLGKDAQGQPIPNPNQKQAGVLGNFILMFIFHLYDIKNFTFNMQHYFQILARFASLGPEAREFLLRAKMVGRLMDFFFEQASPYRELYSNMEDLGEITLNEQTELGLPTVINKKFNSYFQMLQEKRRKQQLSSATPKYKYLMEVVSLCVRHMKLNSQQSTQYQLDKDYPVTVTGFITQQEGDIFIPEAKFLKRFILEAKRNRSINSVVKAHVHYAYFDEDHVEELFKTVEHGLSDTTYDYDRIRPFMCLLETLLTTNHVNFTSKLDDWLKRFLRAVQANVSFYKWMEVGLDYIFKFVGRHEHIRLWFYNNEKQWKFLYEWLSANQQPPHMSQMQHGGVRLYKNRQNFHMNTMQNFTDNSNTMKNRINTAYRFRKLKEMIHQKVKDLSNEPDTDKLDYQDFKFVQGDIVTVIDRKSTDTIYKGNQWRVSVVLDEMVNLTLNDSEGRNHYKWQKLDTDKIYYGDYYAKLNKNVEKQESYEIKQQQKIDAQARQNARNYGNEEEGGQGGNNRNYQKKKNQNAQGDGAAGTNRDMSSDDYDSSDDENLPDGVQQ